jgi:hypothetical protein
MDENERYLLGEYETKDETIAVCKKIVNDFLYLNYKPGMDADELYMIYTSFGEDPFIKDGGPSILFSAWNYAKSRCQSICDEMSANEQIV